MLNGVVSKKWAFPWTHKSFCLSLLLCPAWLGSTDIVSLCMCVCVCVFEREKERAWAEEGAEEEGESIPSRLQTKLRAQCRAQSHDPEIMTWAKIKSWMFNWLSHPGAPPVCQLKKKKKKILLTFWLDLDWLYINLMSMDTLTILNPLTLDHTSTFI